MRDEIPASETRYVGHNDRCGYLGQMGSTTAGSNHLIDARDAGRLFSDYRIRRA